MENLPQGITQEMIDLAKSKHSNVSVAELFDSEGKSFGNFLFGNPNPFAISQFEKFVDKETAKAKAALIMACLPIEEQKEQVKKADKSSDFYAAVFDAAAQMLPVGKAILKKL